MQAQRKGSDIVPTHSQHGIRRRWEVSTMLRPLYPRKDPVPAGWEGLGPVWMDIYIYLYTHSYIEHVA